ncbi:hypothetical protein SDC9_182467 [bioreactor metagenome]|uniref:Uncharacterized protein n=1 Tax=bioreactor metagenome TaxID=1076179 RepID=A0A645HH24_9ZZZZ
MASCKHPSAISWDSALFNIEIWVFVKENNAIIACNRGDATAGGEGLWPPPDEHSQYDLISPHSQSVQVVPV